MRSHLNQHPPFEHLEAAYQLHFYLLFKTRYRRDAFDGDPVHAVLSDTLKEVCSREDYHLLDSRLGPDHLRLLLSLKPKQTISQMVKMLKGNLSRQFSLAFPNRLAQRRLKTLWAEGYYAASSGKVNLAAARSYVDSQVSHHGYRGSWTDALKFKNPNFKSPAFHLAHSACTLAYHLVLVTNRRASVFDDTIATRLFTYALAIGAKRGFAIDRISVLPDHIHFLFEALPSVSVADCASSLMNNTLQWMEKHYSGVLKETGAWDVWQPSFYAGTVVHHGSSETLSGSTLSLSYSGRGLRVVRLKLKNHAAEAGGISVAAFGWLG